MVQQNKKITNSEKSTSEKIKDNYKFKSNNSNKEVDLDQLNELNLGY